MADLNARRFIEYAKAMQRVEDAGVNSKSAADKILAEVEPVSVCSISSSVAESLANTKHSRRGSQELSIRQFLLTNSLIDKETKTLKFRIPLPILTESIPAIGHFPYAPGESIWDGPALFIKGAKARYITERNEPITREFFPNMRLETLDSGHWVHAEKPVEFLQFVKDFVENPKQT